MTDGVVRVQRVPKAAMLIVAGCLLLAVPCSVVLELATVAILRLTGMKASHTPERAFMSDDSEVVVSRCS
jgi:Mg2+/Co2+ transporter CorB